MSEESRPLFCRWVHDHLNRFYSTPCGRHLKNARKEMLLAARALIDRKIEWLDSMGQEAEPRKIEVQ